ncbi:MAG: ATP-binding protein [Thermoguttaceae bacterium]|nr:ATP-binding protein [Thermoguttaceae bacterium]MBR0190955.1 ATP-binding protein [Thermoguttaceae bacterium]
MKVAACFCWVKDFCIPSRTDAGHAILDGVLLQLQDFEWEQKDVFAIQLSFEEAIVNAIRHGNQSNNRLGVRVHLEITPERFLARVEDEGPGFNPDSLPDPTLEDFLDRPCGRGVKLMRAFMTSVHFNPTGNAVTLEKYRSTPVPEKFLVQEAQDVQETPESPEVQDAQDAQEVQKAQEVQEAQEAAPPVQPECTAQPDQTQTEIPVH